MTKKLFSAVALCCLLAATPALAADMGVSLGLGQSEGGVDIYRLGLQRDFGVKWLESSAGSLGGYFEGSAAYWEEGSEDNTVFAITPVFTYSFNLQAHPTVHPYVEAGIGAGYISKKIIDGNDFGSHFQFEDRLGIGVNCRGHKVAAQFFHYSNAGIKEPNTGIDIWLLSYTYPF
ncbi:MAG TPA: acyloxyacyl hydrolase [Desulfurivibrionaceae bacterium]|nr:acyloxyacyl hydrolase [Desulfurivibrionaceae bacterium]